MIGSLTFSQFGNFSLAEYLFNRFIVSVAVICIIYILHNLLKMFYHLIVRRRFWITTFRISPRTLVKSEVWFGIILTPVLYLFGALVLLAVWGVSVDILVARTKGFLTGFNIGMLITVAIVAVATFAPTVGGIIQLILYVWGFFRALSMPFSGWILVFYICFALYFFTQLLPMLLALFSRNR